MWRHFTISIAECIEYKTYGIIQQREYESWVKTLTKSRTAGWIQAMREKCNFRISRFYQVVQKHKLTDVAEWGVTVSFDCLHFCQKMSKSVDMCQSYSKPNVGRFLRHGVHCLILATLNYLCVSEQQIQCRFHKSLSKTSIFVSLAVKHTEVACLWKWGVEVEKWILMIFPNLFRVSCMKKTYYFFLLQKPKINMVICRCWPYCARVKDITMGRQFSPSKLPFARVDLDPSNTWFLGATWFNNQNDIAIDSASFAGHTVVNDTQRHRQTYQ